MLFFQNIIGHLPEINSPENFKDSDYIFLLDLLGNIPLETLFFLNCSDEDSEDYSLYLLIEDNGELVEEVSDFQLFEFDEKRVVLFNSFDERYIFSLKKDIKELSEAF